MKRRGATITRTSNIYYIVIGSLLCFVFAAAFLLYKASVIFAQHGPDFQPNLRRGSGREAVDLRMESTKKHAQSQISLSMDGNPNDSIGNHQVVVPRNSSFKNEPSAAQETRLFLRRGKYPTEKPDINGAFSVVHNGENQLIGGVRHPLGMDTVLLIIASSRPEYLKRCLTHVLKHHPRNAVPIFVSQDGFDSHVLDVVNDAKTQFNNIAPGVPFVHRHHKSDRTRYENGYFKLSDHFKWALDEVFTNNAVRSDVKRVIILEEDLQIAPDFFDFFGATMKYVDQDPTVMAASAWNDNGSKHLAKNVSQLYRSDFFPGLGWMMPRHLWVDELAAKWPKAYWDDWLREPNQRQGRHILRPEVCRTLHYGAKGVSNMEFGSYLSSIELSDAKVSFADLDLSYLDSDKWDKYYLGQVAKARLIRKEDFNFMSQSHKELRVEYNALDSKNPSLVSFPQLAKWSGAMDNIKANVPRTAYKGVVSIWRGDVKLHLVPSNLDLSEWT